VFETKLISFFNGGDDLFRNEAGGTVPAATDAKESEHSSFQGLERFENQGLITMQDRQAGDSFEISNTVGGRDLAFVASGKSTLGVDAFLGKPGSVSDTFTINGDVSGKTVLKVNNTNPGPGVFNKVGIPVVYVNGDVKGDESSSESRSTPASSTTTCSSSRPEAASSSLRAYLVGAPMSCRTSSPTCRTSSTRPVTLGSTAPPICVCS
jgi:hypothetical protein